MKVNGFVVSAKGKISCIYQHFGPESGPVDTSGPLKCHLRIGVLGPNEAVGVSE